MKTLNYIAQIIASILYSGLYGNLLVLICISPLLLIDKLGLFWIFLLCFLGFDVVSGLQFFAQAIVSIPYAWITRNNVVAKTISSILVITAGVFGCIRCWMFVDDMSGWLIAMCIFLTLEITISILLAVYIICTADKD